MSRTDCAPSSLPYCFIASVVMTAGFVSTHRADDPAARKSAQPAAALQAFRSSSPAVRLSQVEKLAGGENRFTPVERADMGVTVEARGAVEPVKGGDTFRMVIPRMPGSLGRRVRVDQETTLAVDASPNQSLVGRVTKVEKAAPPREAPAREGAEYRVEVTLTVKGTGLESGMTGTARIEVELRKKVLQVPVEAVVRSGGEAFCFVKVGKELQERKVKTGGGNELNLEVQEGLKGGEQVLRSPSAVAVLCQAKR